MRWYVPWVDLSVTHEAPHWRTKPFVSFSHKNKSKRRWLSRARRSECFLELHCWQCKNRRLFLARISSSSRFHFSVTILVLIIESRWTESPKQRQFIIENNSTCWQREEYEIIRDCHPCTGNIPALRSQVKLADRKNRHASAAFEIASKSKGVCIHTHNKEVLRCKSGETVSRR